MRAPVALPWLLVACKSAAFTPASLPPAPEPVGASQAPDAAEHPTPSAPDSLQGAALPMAAPDAARPRMRDAVGPFELPMLPERTVWYARPRSAEEHRLIAHLHGQCAHPAYSCGKWFDAGAERGFVVCPTGNERCGGGNGPPKWEESFGQMDADLERAIEIVRRAEGDGGITREDAVMTGFSRGGWAAIELVRRHPGRWPLVIIIEADVTLTASALRAAKVARIALIAADHGTELRGERQTVEALKAADYPAELFVMPQSWHLYSANIDDVMRAALAFVLAAPHDGGARSTSPADDVPHEAP